MPEFSPGGVFLRDGKVHLHGTLDGAAAGAVEAIVAALDPAAPDLVIDLDSPGGHFPDAERIVKAVSGTGKRLVVRVEAGHACASACVLLFAAAHERRVDPTAEFLFHSATCIQPGDGCASGIAWANLEMRLGVIRVSPALAAFLNAQHPPAFEREGPRNYVRLTGEELAGFGGAALLSTNAGRPVREADVTGAKQFRF